MHVLTLTIGLITDLSQDTVKTSYELDANIIPVF